MSKGTSKAAPQVTVSSVADEPRSSGEESSSASLKAPRVARFTEATSIISPVEPSNHAQPSSPFNDHITSIRQPADINRFSSRDSKEVRETTVEMPTTPFTPMRSALKVPGTPGRFIDPRSPTFREEVALERQEIAAEKQNAKDLTVKVRVRVAKFFLRSVNFSCSLIILSMLSTTFTIFNATKSLPPRNNFPPWASGQQTWPQIVLLSMACVSLAVCMIIFWSYRKGGHRKAAKTAGYYTLFAMGTFIFSTAMWITGAAVLHSSKSNGGGQDMWGWSCNTNKRSTLFDDTINYALICRLQNWSLICALIEIVVEVITITIYLVVFYRFRSKRKLHKSMDNRDKARSDLYLATLKAQSAPNTPGFKSIKSPVGHSFYSKDLERGENDDKRFSRMADAEYESRHRQAFGSPRQPSFVLQPPPIKVHGATPNPDGGSFETQQEHAPVAPGEETYEAVPIPGAYAYSK